MRASGANFSSIPFRTIDDDDDDDDDDILIYFDMILSGWSDANECSRNKLSFLHLSQGFSVEQFVPEATGRVCCFHAATPGKVRHCQRPSEKVPLQLISVDFLRSADSWNPAPLKWLVIVMHTHWHQDSPTYYLTQNSVAAVLFQPVASCCLPGSCTWPSAAVLSSAWFLAKSQVSIVFKNCQQARIQKQK